jgi:folate-binding protein YgfZ
VDNKIESFSKIDGIFPWKPAAWLAVTGDDAFSFLQGQFSSDLRPLEQGGSVYGLWLDRKGKVLADSFVGQDPRTIGQYWIGSYTSAADTIRQRLEDFVVADDVMISDETSRYEGLTVPEAVNSAQLAEILQRLGAISFPARRGFPAREWIFDNQSEHRAALDEWLQRLPEFSLMQMETCRIHARIPAIPADIGPGDLPQEGGLETDAVSFSKGCYLGQEVMARLKTMGSVRRQLFRVSATIELPKLPAPLFQNGKRVGELRTAISDAGKFIGLALLSTLNLKVEFPLYFAEADTADRAIAIDLT